jgi:hypothetical protein
LLAEAADEELDAKVNQLHGELTAAARYTFIQESDCSTCSLASSSRAGFVL